MNLVDSSGWLEYFAGGKNARFFAPAIESAAELLVPTICVAEVFRRVLQQRGEDAALQAAAAMHQGRMVSLDAPLALAAARLGASQRLALADSVILATAQAHCAQLWTQDSDFAGMLGVRYTPA